MGRKNRRQEPYKNPHALAALVRTRVEMSLIGTTTRAAAATQRLTLTLTLTYLPTTHAIYASTLATKAYYGTDLSDPNG